MFSHCEHLAGEEETGCFQVSILYKSIAGRYRPVRVADGPITARYRFIKNACWVPFLWFVACVLSVLVCLRFLLVPLLSSCIISLRPTVPNK